MSRLENTKKEKSNVVDFNPTSVSFGIIGDEPSLDSIRKHAKNFFVAHGLPNRTVLVYNDADRFTTYEVTCSRLPQSETLEQIIKVYEDLPF